MNAQSTLFEKATPQRHAREVFGEVEVGHKLTPIPLWNQSERPLRQLPQEVEVLGIEKAQSQTGILFLVSTKGGSIERLDAGWFELP